MQSFLMSGSNLVTGHPGIDAAQSQSRVPEPTEVLRSHWWRKARLGRAADGGRGDGGFGLIEVVVALTVLLIISAAVGWVIVSSVGADTLSQQRSSAASLIEQRDAYLQANVPTTSCSTAAATYQGTSTQAVAAGSSGSTTYTIATTASTANNMLAATITVSWHAAFPSSQTSSLAGQVQVPCLSS